MKKLAIRAKIERRTGNILDIGSGNNVLDISTHLVDLIPEANVERGGDIERPGNKIFVQGNVESLPFSAKFFDFAHAAHVLEHVQSPEKALAELTRTAYSGYIETPAPVFEQGSYFKPDLPGWDFHRWYVWSFPCQKKIYFKPKTSANVRQYCSCEAGKLFEKILKKTDYSQLDALVPYYCKMTQFQWKDSIDFEVWTEDQQGHTTEISCSCFYSSFFQHMRIYFRSLRYFSKRVKLKKKLPEVYQILKRDLPR